MYSLHMFRIIGKLNSFIFLKVILRNSDYCYLIYLEFYKWLENRLYQLGFDSFVKWPWLIKTEHKPSVLTQQKQTESVLSISTLERPPHFPDFPLHLEYCLKSPCHSVTYPPLFWSCVALLWNLQHGRMCFPLTNLPGVFQEQLLLNMRENRKEIITENIQSLKIALFPTAGLCFYKSRWKQESCVGQEALSALANPVPPFPLVLLGCGLPLVPWPSLNPTILSN